MKKKDKTSTGKQKKYTPNQNKVHKSGINFDVETFKQLEIYAAAEFKGNRSEVAKN